MLLFLAQRSTSTSLAFPVSTISISVSFSEVELTEDDEQDSESVSESALHSPDTPIRREAFVLNARALRVASSRSHETGSSSWDRGAASDDDLVRTADAGAVLLLPPSSPGAVSAPPASVALAESFALVCEDTPSIFDALELKPLVNAPFEMTGGIGTTEDARLRLRTSPS